MSDEKKAFTVSDRRHFTSDGEPRPDPGPPTPVAAEGSGGTPKSSPVEQGPRADAPVSVTLESFVLSIGAQAGTLLQGLPARGEAPALPADLPAARQMIAILEMLQDKTEARRTERETRLLEEVLFELRMGFVEASRREAK